MSDSGGCRWRTFVPGVAIWRAAGRAAAATPPDRDRVVDLVRSASLAVVVLGHILMAVVVWDDGTPRIRNLLDLVPALRFLTWVLQVMPLFFAAGAVANRSSWLAAEGRGEPWRVWCWMRLRRLVRPVVPYLAVWIPLLLLLQVLLPDAAAGLARLSTQLLWFLGVYVVVVALTPLEVRLARGGWRSVVGLLAVTALVDLGRFHIFEGIDLLNFVVVWVLAAVVGLVVRDRSGSGVALLGVAAGAFAANLVLIRFGPYPLSMVGLPGERISNMAPPTLVLAFHAVALIAVVGAARPVLVRVAARVRVWQAVCAVGGVAMTLYLWHLTALVLVTVAEHQLGLDRPTTIGPGFWLATIAHLIVLLAAVVVMVTIAAPLEFRPLPWLERARESAADTRWRLAAEIVGVTGTAIGFLVLAGTGVRSSRLPRRDRARVPQP
ncbi:MAG: acyltransferase family protein, partial [Actinomycetota bacterium]